MNAFINYLIEANLGLIFFSVIYFLLLHRETQFNVKRVYLLGAMLASVVFPLMEFTSTQPIIPSISSVMEVTYLPEIIVRAGQSATSSMTINYWNIAIGTYLVITSILFILFCIRIGRLILTLRSDAFVHVDKFRIIESNTNHPTFSFFHYIFIGNADQLDQSEKDQVINHEKLHASRIHSLDLLFSELLKIAFWFNPMVYAVKNQLVSIHEFEADQQAVQHQDPDLYCDLLARTSLTSSGVSLVHHFHNSLTLKRILMINTKKTKIKSWKYVVLIPVFVTGLVMISCEDQMKSDVKVTSKDYPEEIVTQLKQLKNDYPGDEYLVIEETEEGKEKLRNLNIQNIGQGEYKNVKFIYTNPTANDPGRSFVILIKGTRQQVADPNSKLASAEIDGRKIYTAVQQNPRFPGGRSALVKYLSNELQYPPQARRMGIEGKVFVQFIVNEDGTVSDVKAIKGIGAGCDDEAVRVVANSPKWIPGKQDGQVVNVRYVVPINFML